MTPRKKAVYRPMTPDEVVMAHALMPGFVSYLPGSFDKRFAGVVWDAKEITEPQSVYLRVMVWRYRRQLPAVVRAYVPNDPLKPSMEARPAPVPVVDEPAPAPVVVDPNQVAFGWMETQ